MTQRALASPAVADALLERCDGAAGGGWRWRTSVSNVILVRETDTRHGAAESLQARRLLKLSLMMCRIRRSSLTNLIG